jgi:hypothetical protein
VTWVIMYRYGQWVLCQIDNSGFENQYYSAPNLEDVVRYANRSYNLGMIIPLVQL